MDDMRDTAVTDRHLTLFGVSVRRDSLSKLVYFSWMLGITLLYWLINNGPVSRRIESSVAILKWAKQILLQIFTSKYVY